MDNTKTDPKSGEICLPKRTILLVDDSAISRMVFQRCIEVVGLRDATFIGAGNGKEALEILRKVPIDLLITDLNMPVMDGMKLLMVVKSSPRLNPTPVLIVTAQGNPAMEAEVKRIGAMKMINKPLSPGKLKGFLEEVFGKEVFK